MLLISVRAVVTGAAYAGIFGAAGGAIVDHYRTKGEVAELEKKAKAARDARDEQVLPGHF